MSTPQANSSFGSAKELLEIVTKLSVLVVGTCYITGLIVVNAHLNKFGVYNMNLFETEYITAGLLALLPVLTSSTLGFGMVVKPSTHFSRKGQVGLLAIVLLASSILSLIPLYISPFFSRFLWKAAITVLTGNVLSLCLVLVFLMVKDSYVISNKLYKVIYLIMFTAFFFILHGGLFGKGVYGEIPRNLGGGRPSRIQIVIDPDSQSFLKTAGIPFGQEPSQTEELQLILITEKDLLVALPMGERAVSIPLDSVKAVIYIHMRL